MEPFDGLLDTVESITRAAKELSEIPEWTQASTGMITLEDLSSWRTRKEELHARLNALDYALADAFREAHHVEATGDQRERARTLIGRLYLCSLEDLRFATDYILEVRSAEYLASENRHSPVLFFLISVAGQHAALDRENHGLGYHFHYVLIGRKSYRTAVVLTFDPQEHRGPPDTLYWFRHGPGVHADPARWGTRRRRAVHSATSPSLANPGKTNFLQPGPRAKVLISA